MYRSLLLAPLLLTAACGDRTAPTDANAIEPTPVAPATESPSQVLPATEVTPVPEPTTTATKGGDGSALELSPLQAKDSADLQGELACAFTLPNQSQPILIGRGDVDKDSRATAIIRIGDYPERLMARTPGGFGAMERGTSFGGKGMTVTLERGTRQDTGDESSAYRATLLAQRADGAERSFAGLWTCGP